MNISKELFFVADDSVTSGDSSGSGISGGGILSIASDDSVTNGDSSVSGISGVGILSIANNDSVTIGNSTAVDAGDVAELSPVGISLGSWADDAF